MSDINDGGPAYPRTNEGICDNGYVGFLDGYDGMTLRDWFAGRATEEDVRKHQKREWVKGGLGICGNGYWTNITSRETAKYAYADEMIKTRGKSS